MARSVAPMSWTHRAGAEAAPHDGREPVGEVFPEEAGAAGSVSRTAYAGPPPHGNVRGRKRGKAGGAEAGTVRNAVAELPWHTGSAWSWSDR